MDKNVYQASCNIYETCNDDEDYQEACKVSSARLSAARTSHNSVTGTAKTGNSPGQSQARTCSIVKTLPVMTILLNLCLLGTVIFLVVAVYQLDQQTALNLSDLKLSVIQLDKKSLMSAAYLSNISAWIQQMVVKSEQGGIAEETPVPTDSCTGRCPTGFKKYRKVCYKVFNIEKTFMQASATCLSVGGGTLAMPRDAGINAFLFSLLKAADRYKNYWFGLHDLVDEGKWEWVDGTDLGTGNYSAWREGQPDQWGDQDCAMYRDDQWVDAECHWKHPFICQVIP
ncbi:hypothetical protein Bbelb_062920 [Branchiostoma belcheri]|nr:hypothetical protein Bbelb_062920 [Branchiostoma belcheri]